MDTGSGIKAVIFDMDGVLTDSEPLINAAAVAMFRERGVQVQPEDFLPFVGTGEDRYIGGVAEKHGVQLDLAEAKRRTYEIYLELVPSRLRAFPGARELVASCRAAGLKTVVASSADRIKIAANLKQIGLPLEPGGAWDAVVTGEDVSNKKPAPDIFLQAACRLGLSPQECVVIEDAINGVQAARAAGMRCVAVAQTFPAATLDAANLVKPSIAEVRIWDLTGSPPPLGEGPAGGQNPTGRLVAGAPGAKGPWGFWATTAFGVGILFASLIAQSVTMILILGLVHGFGGDWELAANHGLVLSVATTASLPVGVGLCGLLAWVRRGPRVTDYLGVKPVSLRAIILWCSALLVMVALSDLLTWRLGRPIVPDFMFEVVRSAFYPPLLWFALVVAAPVGEEVLFRGFLFTGLRHSPAGAVGAIVLTSLGWAAIHVQYDAYGMGTVFVSGLLLGYARLRTNSILAPILMHGLMNFVATVETLWLAQAK